MIARKNKSDRTVDTVEDVTDTSDPIKDNGYFVLMDEINQDSCREVVEWILEENFKKKKRHSHLTLLICSEGGSLEDAFAVIDVMKGSKIPVYTVGLGFVGSAAFCIFIAGTHGFRVLTPNTALLSHQFSWHSEGKEHELFAAIKGFDLTRRRMTEHYKKCVNLSEEDIRKYLLPPEDVWLSAEEALTLGLCDNITKTY
jgi:ATP-dependent Clp protease protease subunit